MIIKKEQANMKRQALELEASWGAQAPRISDRIIEEGTESRVYP
jgi:hypothetical protein